MTVCAGGDITRITFISRDGHEPEKQWFVVVCGFPRTTDLHEPPEKWTSCPTATVAALSFLMVHGHHSDHPVRQRAWVQGSGSADCPHGPACQLSGGCICRSSTPSSLQGLDLLHLRIHPLLSQQDDTCIQAAGLVLLPVRSLPATVEEVVAAAWNQSMKPMGAMEGRLAGTTRVAKQNGRLRGQKSSVLYFSKTGTPQTEPWNWTMNQASSWGFSGSWFGSCFSLFISYIQNLRAYRFMDRGK